jgi:hypothetical protein
MGVALKSYGRAAVGTTNLHPISANKSARASSSWTKGWLAAFTTDTLHRGFYAFAFDQQGLMAGLGLQGSKIMRLD